MKSYSEHTLMCSGKVYKILKNKIRDFSQSCVLCKDAQKFKNLVQNSTNLVKTVNLLAVGGHNSSALIFKDQGHIKTVWNFGLYMTVEFQVKLQGFSSPLYFSYQTVLPVELQAQGCVVGKRTVAIA